MNEKKCYEEVKQKIGEMILQKGYNFKLCSVNKINTIREGMIIETGNISPNIYLDSCYKNYMEGKTLEEIVDDIIKHTLDNANMSFKMPSSKEELLNKCFCIVINTEANKEWLKKLPHREIMDLSIVYKYLVGENDEKGFATTPVTNELAESFDVSEEELYNHSYNTTLFQAEIENLIHRLYELYDENINEEDFPLYVCTNTIKLYGAAIAFTHPFLLKDVAEKLNSDLYILPSSVHEVLLAPADMDCEIFQEMVRSINDAVVAPDERLSDNVYLYNREKGIITMAS